MNVVSSWNFLINFGYNKFIIDSPLFVKKGYMVYLSQNDTGKIAIDQSGSALFCEIAWKNYIEKLSPNINYRFFLKPLINFTSYQSLINLYHSYSTPGIYSVTLEFMSSNETFINTVNITDCKSYLIIILTQ